MSDKRKKTDEEKSLATKREHTNVTRKLSHMCKDPDLLTEIRSSCIVLKQVQLGAWHIANLHVLRCLENDIKLPTLSQTFFGWRCQGACATGIREAKPKAEKDTKLDRQRKSARPVNEELRETVRLYRSERESIRDYTPLPQFEYDNNILLEVASKMRVSAENMVVLRFKKRLYMCTRLLLEEKSKDKVPASEVSRLVRACYHVEDSDLAEDEMDLCAWLGFIPYENVIKSNLEHFVAKLYEILTKVDASQQKDSNKKGIRSFSLLPYSSTYAAAHVVINGSTLQGLCARIFKETNGRNPLDISLTKSGKALISNAEIYKSKELYLRRAFAVSQFETMLPNGMISKREFNAMDHESNSLFASRMFANQTTMNGYSASVLLSRQKLVSKTSKKELRTKQTKTEEAFDEEWRFLPEGYEANALVAIDPGLRSLRTAVSEGTKTKKKKKETTHGGRPSRHVGAEKIHSIKAQEAQEAVCQHDRQYPAIQDRQLRVVLEASERVLEACELSHRVQCGERLPQVAVLPVENDREGDGRNSETPRVGRQPECSRGVRRLESSRRDLRSRIESSKGIAESTQEASNGGARGRVQDQQAVLGLSLATRASSSPDEVERSRSRLEEDQKRFVLCLQ